MCTKCFKLVSLEEGHASALCIIFFYRFEFFFFFDKKVREGNVPYLNKTGLEPLEDKSSPFCFKSLFYPNGKKSRLMDFLKWKGRKGNLI